MSLNLYNTWLIVVWELYLYDIAWISDLDNYMFYISVFLCFKSPLKTSTRNNVFESKLE